MSLRVCLTEDCYVLHSVVLEENAKASRLTSLQRSSNLLKYLNTLAIETPMRYLFKSAPTCSTCICQIFAVSTSTLHRRLREAKKGLLDMVVLKQHRYGKKSATVTALESVLELKAQYNPTRERKEVVGTRDELRNEVAMCLINSRSVLWLRKASQKVGLTSLSNSTRSP